MQLKKINKFIEKNPLLALGLTLAILGFLVLLGFIGMRFFNQTGNKKSVAVVTVADGQNEIIVERSGRVTIKTPFGTYTQNWDPEKIRKFFEDFDQLDFEKLSQFVGTDLAIKLTLNTGQTVYIDNPQAYQSFVDFVQQMLEKVYENNDQASQAPNLSQYLNPTPTPKASGQNGEDETGDQSDDTNNPQQTPKPSTSSSDNPWQTGSDSNNTAVFNCEQVDSKTGKKIVISNTVCAK